MKCRCRICGERIGDTDDRLDFLVINLTEQEFHPLHVHVTCLHGIGTSFDSDDDDEYASARRILHGQGRAYPINALLRHEPFGDLLLRLLRERLHTMLLRLAEPEERRRPSIDTSNSTTVTWEDELRLGYVIPRREEPKEDNK